MRGRHSEGLLLAMTSRLFLFVVCLLGGLVCAAFLSRGDSVSLSLGVSKLVILRHRFGCVLFHRVCLLFVFRKFVPPHKDSLSPGLTKSIGYITASRLYVIPRVWVTVYVFIAKIIQKTF